MCGIFGYIGKSNDPKLTYQILTKLFIKTEIRGVDASGFYCLEEGDRSIMYDKEDKKASEYVKDYYWKDNAKDQIEGGVDLFIGHCRQTSTGVGPEKINKNNHPHVSEDRSIGVVHNGRVPEYSILKSKYDLQSDCDSEILLKMYETAPEFLQDKVKEIADELPELSNFAVTKLLGIREIFSRVNLGAMAVAIAERGEDDSRHLWLFRDDERPMQIIDLRKTLGQIFFCSTPEIWRNVLNDLPELKNHFSNDHPIMELPPLQVWYLSLVKKDGQLEWNNNRIEVQKTKYLNWKDDDEDDKISFKKKLGVQNKKHVALVKSRLGQDEELPVKYADTEDLLALTSGEEKKKEVFPNIVNSCCSDDDDDTYDLTTDTDIVEEKIDMEKFEAKLETIAGLLDNLNTAVHNASKMENFTNTEYSSVLDSLETIRLEILSTTHSIPS